jgi:hypothetical protein
LLVDRLADQRAYRSADRASEGISDRAQDKRRHSAAPALAIGRNQRPLRLSRSFDDSPDARTGVDEPVPGSDGEMKLPLSGSEDHQRAR